MTKKLELAASLYEAMNDPLSRLIALYGEENGTGLFGAAEGEAPAGFFSRIDAEDLVPGQRGLTKDGQNVARWHVAVKSPFTHGSWEYGDSYIESVINGASLVYGDECFTEDYARDHGEQGRAVSAYRKGLPD